MVFLRSSANPTFRAETRHRLEGNTAGDQFWDTTTNQLLIWTGTEWVPINAELALGDLTDVSTIGVVDGQVLAYEDGNGWVPVSPGSLTVSVDLDYSAAADKGTITNTAGDNAEIPLATGTNAGLSLNNFTTAEKDKLDGYPDDPADTPVPTPDLQAVTDEGSTTTNGAEFGGDVDIANPWNRAANQDSARLSNGAYYGQRSSDKGASAVFRGLLSTNDASDSVITSEIFANGSAQFASGNVELSNTSDDYGIVAIRNTGGNQFYLTYAESDVLGLTARSGTIANQTQPIKFNGVDGSATFAGNVQVGTWTNGTNSTQEGAYIYNSGAITVSRIDGANDILKGHTQGAVTSTISADGKATFAGDVQVAGNPHNGAENGAKLYADGAIYSARPVGTSSCFRGFTVGNSTPTSSILADGSASFAGSVEVSADGTNKAIVHRNGFVSNDRSSGDNTIFEGKLSGSQTSLIKADGSATFAGGGTFGSTTKIFDTSGGRNVTAGLCRSNSGQSYGLTIAPADDENNFTAFIKADGTATFTGQVNGRFFQSKRDTGGATCFEGVLDDGINPSSQTTLIKADGSATFVGSVDAARLNAATVNDSDTAIFVRSGLVEGVRILGDGSATFAGGELQIFASGSIRTNGQLYVSDTTQLNANGTATFESTITAGGYSLANLQEL